MPFAHLSRRDALRLALLAGGGLISGGALAGPQGRHLHRRRRHQARREDRLCLHHHHQLAGPAHRALQCGASYAVQVYDALLGYDDAGAIAPALATPWKRVDELTVELTLRDGVTFHDGGAFDAETVVANIARLTDGGAEVSATKSFLGAVAKATAVDARTVRITTTTPDPVLFNRLTRIDMVDPAVFGNAGDKASGTGPFRVTGYTPGQRVELEAFAGSWRATDRVASATIQGIPDAGTMASALRAGEVDIAFGLGATQAEQLRSQFGILHPSAGSAAICSLISDVEPKLADPRVREALNLAINRDEFVDAGLAGYGKPSNGQLLQEGLTRLRPDHHTARASTPIAPGRCSRRPGAEGIRLNIATTAIFKSQAEIVAGYLNAVGIESEVEIQELSLFIGTLLGTSKTPLLYWQTDYFDLRDIISVTRFGPQPPQVQKHFANERYVELYQQAGTELDETKRAGLIQEMAQDPARRVRRALPGLARPGLHPQQAPRRGRHDRQLAGPAGTLRQDANEHGNLGRRGGKRPAAAAAPRRAGAAPHRGAPAAPGGHHLRHPEPALLPDAPLRRPGRGARRSRLRPRRDRARPARAGTGPSAGRAVPGLPAGHGAVRPRPVADQRPAGARPGPRPVARHRAADRGHPRDGATHRRPAPGCSPRPTTGGCRDA